MSTQNEKKIVLDLEGGGPEYTTSFCIHCGKDIDINNVIDFGEDQCICNDCVHNQYG